MRQVEQGADVATRWQRLGGRPDAPGLGVGVGVGVGLNLGKVELTPRQEAYLIFPGEMFLRMLKMLILPLMCVFFYHMCLNLQNIIFASYLTPPFLIFYDLFLF